MLINMCENLDSIPRARAYTHKSEKYFICVLVILGISMYLLWIQRTLYSIMIPTMHL